MQGFSSSFPRGGAGAGLLLLRLAVATQLAVTGAGAVAWWQLLLLGVLVLLLVPGLLTQVAAAVGAVYQLLCLASAPWAVAPYLAIAALTAAALLLLGPGAYALDAGLFGRRRLVLPQQTDGYE
ncbi:hypothetical protein ACLB1G_03855 [Oxalobacteraceae bacterium A2-2]